QHLSPRLRIVRIVKERECTVLTYFAIDFRNDFWPLEILWDGGKFRFVRLLSLRRALRSTTAPHCKPVKWPDLLMDQRESKDSISFDSFSGLEVGEKRPTTQPWRSMRNFVKFHLMRSVQRKPGRAAFR